MSLTTKKLKEAISLYRQEATEAYEQEAIQAFIALYNMLGKEELHDGIQSAMQDNGYEETYEGIIYHYENLDDIDYIIEESGE